MNTVNMQHLEMLYNQGVQSHNNGDFQAALNSYETILNAAPNQIETNFQMGRLILQSDTPNQSISFFERAVMLAPERLEFWNALVESLAKLGMRKQAIKTVKKARGKRFTEAEMANLDQLARGGSTAIGEVPKEKIDQVNEYFNRGDLVKARAVANELVLGHPTVAFVHNLLGAVLLRIGEIDEAEKSFRKAIIIDPLFADVRNNLGKLLTLQKNHAEAAMHLQIALSLSKNMVAAKINLASAYSRLGRLNEAESLIKNLDAQVQKNTEVRWNYAGILYDQGNYEKAYKIFRALGSENHAGLNVDREVVESLFELDRFSDVTAYLDARISEADDPGELLTLKGSISNRRGDFAAAEESFRASLKIGANAGHALRQIGMVKKWQKNDSLIVEMERLYEDGSLDDDQNIELGFALGKAMEDTGQQDKVFKYLNFANAILSKQGDYAKDEVKADFETVKSVMNRAYFSELPVKATSDATPIFILGMPRSGTTLTEQVISNHRDVAGAGEVASIVGAVSRLLADKEHKIKPAANIGQEEYLELGKTCVGTLRQKFPDAKFITDKTLNAFEFLGMIATALPNAKIVHVHRNPIDNCLSMYKNHLRATGFRYTTNLDDLGFHYCLYKDLMAYWNSLFGDRIVNVDYDKLVADPDTRIRKLIDQLGLDWDENCLSTEKNTREVKTLSLFQARQPIYKSSVEGWRKYEKDLAPLIAALKAGGAISA